MYCGNCGHEIQEGDLYCGECGAAVKQEQEHVLASQRITVKKPLSKTQKIAFSIVGCLILLLAVAYVIARQWNGPSSPQELETRFTHALKNKDMNALKPLLVDDNEITDDQIMAAFANSLSNEVMDTYISEFETQIDLMKNYGNGNQNLNTSSRKWLSVRKENTWLGETWKVHVAPVSIKAVPLPIATTELSLGNLHSDKNGELKNLWPSDYTCQATIQGDFGKETVTKRVNFMEDINQITDTGTYTENLSFDNEVKNKLRIYTTGKAIDGLQIFINGKAIGFNNNTLEQLLYPISGTVTLEAKASVLGVPIDEKQEISVNGSQDFDIQQLVNHGIAKHALDILYNALLSKTQAINAGNISLLKNADPNGSFYKNVASFINENDGKRKINLVEMAVNPDQVEWDQDSIRIDSYELYTNSGDSSKDEEILSYILQQVPGKQEWWIESSSYSFDYFKDSIRAPYLKKATAQ